MDIHLKFRCPLRTLPMRDGRFECASCGHVVTDLATLSADEARAWLATAPKGACVRVRRARSSPRGVVVAVGVAALLSGSIAAAQSSPCSPTDVSTTDEFEFGGAGDDFQSPHEPTAVLAAHASGWLDEGAVVNRVLEHPGPYRRVLEPLTGDDRTATLVLVVRPDGTVQEARTRPEGRGRTRRLLALRFPASPSGGKVVVHYGPPRPHLYLDPVTGERCPRRDEQ